MEGNAPLGAGEGEEEGERSSGQGYFLPALGAGLGEAPSPVKEACPPIFPSLRPSAVGRTGWGFSAWDGGEGSSKHAFSGSFCPKTPNGEGGANSRAGLGWAPEEQKTKRALKPQQEPLPRLWQTQTLSSLETSCPLLAVHHVVWFFLD